jgi:hypothetical protein
MDAPISDQRKVVDLNAVLWAGLIAGFVFLLVNMFISVIVLDTPWVFVRMSAAILLGEQVLPPPASFDLMILAAALVVHLALSLVFTALLALIVHRWDLPVAVIAGALFGLALYAINFYSFSYFFPWFYPLRSWIIVISHIVFGATAGGLYEAIELQIDEEARA